MTRYPLLAALLLLFAPAIATATAPAPPPVRLPADIDPTDTLAAMIAAAYRTGDDATINAVVGVAKATFPNEVAVIDRLAAGDAAVLAQTRKDAQESERIRIQQARFFEIWKGELEAGASRSTGTTRSLGVYASAKLARDGLNWRQKFSARLDFQQTDNITTTERLIAAWQPNYKFDERLYAYGLTQYEHDRTLGYNSRFTIGAGVGYTVLATGNAKLEVEAGPAFRHTDYTDYTEEPTHNTVAARASLTGKIALSPTISISQDAALFFETKDTTISATTALETTLIGALKAKFSYNIQYEQNAPEGAHALDTVTRATLVYGF
jgi:putative salt-induced outer membrane protein